MMKLRLLFSLLLVLGSIFATNAQAQWQQTSGPVGVDLYTIASAGDTLYAATGGGLYRQLPGSPLWKPLGFPARAVTNVWAHNQLLFAALLDTVPNTYYARDLFYSSDGGLSWSGVQGLLKGAVQRYWAFGAQQDSTGTREILYASVSLVDFSGVNLARSTDSGATWSPVPATTGLPNLWVRGLITVGDTLFAATNGGLYMKPRQTSRWSRITTLPRTTIETGICYDGTTLFVGTSDGIYRSSDRQSFVLNASVVNVIHFAVLGTTIIADDSLEYYITNDRGNRWTSLSSVGFGGDHFGLLSARSQYYFSTNKHVLRLNAQATGVETNDSGIVNNDAYAFATVRGKLYATTKTGIFRTSDGGDSWHNFTNPNYPGVATHLAASSTSTSIFAGGIGLFRTHDDGVTWDTVHGGLDGFSNVTALAASGSHVFVGSDITTASALHISSDDGATWVKADSTVTGIVYAIYSQDPLVIALTSEGDFRSIDNGATWIKQLAPDYSGVFGISLSASNNTIVANADGVFLSRDAGLTWDYEMTGLPGRDQITAVSLRGAIGVVGTTSGVYISRDTGRTWKATVSTLQSEIAAVASDDSYLYAGTLGSSVWRLPLLNARVTESSTQPKQELRFYPNPFGRSATIAFTLTEPAEVVAELYDMLGRRISTVIVGSYTAGAHSTSYSSSVLPSGIYTLQLKTITTSGHTVLSSSLITHLQ